MSALWGRIKAGFRAIEAALVLAVVLLLGVWAVVATIRQDQAEGALEKLRNDQAEAVAKAVSDARAEETRRFLAQKEIADGATTKAQAALAAAAAASSAAGRLRRELDALATRYVAGSAAAIQGGPSAPGAAMVPAELFSHLVQRSRQLVDRSVDLADLADKRGIAGEACERAYDSLTLKP